MCGFRVENARPRERGQCEGLEAGQGRVCWRSSKEAPRARGLREEKEERDEGKRRAKQISWVPVGIVWHLSLSVMAAIAGRAVTVSDLCFGKVFLRQPDSSLLGCDRGDLFLRKVLTRVSPASQFCVLAGPRSDIKEGWISVFSHRFLAVSTWEASSLHLEAPPIAPAAPTAVPYPSQPSQVLWAPYPL